MERHSCTEKSRRRPTKGTRKTPNYGKTSPADRSAASRALPQQATTTGAVRDRRGRVWKACERCRFRKTKCDGKLPCNRCNDDGIVCTASRPRKGVYKQPLKGYIQVLECHQLTLIATVRKLYAMVRGGQAWHLSEPNLNDHGLPIVHNIADKLGCIQPHSDADLAAFPEDEAGMAELAAQLHLHTDHVGSSRINDNVVAPRSEDEHDLDSQPEMTPDSCAALSTHGYANSHHDFAFTSQPMDISQGAMASSAFPGFTGEKDNHGPELACEECTAAVQADGFPNALVQGGGDYDVGSKPFDPSAWAQISDIMMDMGDPRLFAFL